MSVCTFKEAFPPTEDLISWFSLNSFWKSSTVLLRQCSIAESCSRCCRTSYQIIDKMAIIKVTEIIAIQDITVHYSTTKGRITLYVTHWKVALHKVSVVFQDKFHFAIAKSANLKSIHPGYLQKELLIICYWEKCPKTYNKMDLLQINITEFKLKKTQPSLILGFLSFGNYSGKVN